MNRIDLHVHTTASDGSVSPADVVKEAKQLGLSAIAITDHDTFAGCSEAIDAGKQLGVEVVPGIEISTFYGSSVHILGYYIDTASPVLINALQELVDNRNERNRKIAALMAADGLPVDYDELCARFGEVIGRPHFAALLVEFGLAKDINDAFARYVSRGKRYYLPRSIIRAERYIGVIRAAGGIPVLAHPFQYRLDDLALRSMLTDYMEYGLMGIECRYTGYDKSRTDYLESLAEEYGLLKTGGSDFHGANKKHIQLGRGTAAGELEVPAEFLEQLKLAKSKI